MQDISWWKAIGQQQSFDWIDCEFPKNNLKNAAPEKEQIFILSHNIRGG